MNATLASTAGFLVAGLVLLNGLMYLLQPFMVFFPYRDLDETPADWGLAYEDAGFEASDGVLLHGWYILHDNPDRVLLFLHGNAGNISHRSESVAVFHDLGLNVLLFDYRGYGRSEGKPGEVGLYADAAAAWRYLTERKGFSGDQVVIFGRSLGAAIGAHLAAKVRAGGLILESPFSSGRDVAKALYPILSRLVVNRFDFNTTAHLQDVESPVLVLHSPEDEIIPFRLGEKVYQAAREPKRFFRMRGSHNLGFLESQPEYGRALREFIAGLGAAAWAGCTPRPVIRTVCMTRRLTDARSTETR